MDNIKFQYLIVSYEEDLLNAHRYPPMLDGPSADGFCVETMYEIGCSDIEQAIHNAKGVKENPNAKHIEFDGVGFVDNEKPSFIMVIPKDSEKYLSTMTTMLEESYDWQSYREWMKNGYNKLFEN